MAISNRILVLYGSQTFTAQELAERIWRTTKGLGFQGPVQAMDDYPISQLINEEFAIFVCSTTGQGDEPDNMKSFWKFMLRRSLPTNSLSKLKFGVLGLGDSSYPKFNFAAKKMNKRLIQLGATPLVNVGLCDYQHDLGHDAVMAPWTKEFFSKLKIYHPNINMNNSEAKFLPRWKVTLLTDQENDTIASTSEDIYFSNTKNYGYLEPLFLELEENVRTSVQSHFQDVRMITLKAVDGHCLDYNPGDVFNIRPRNSKEDINQLFTIFKSHGIDIKPYYKLLVDKYHQDMPVPDFLKEPLTMYQIAEQYWDLRAYPTQYIFSLLALVSQDTLERDKCIELSTPEGQEEWLNYCRRPKRTILEVLQDFHKSTSKLTIDILFELFSPIKPRSFSIASSRLPSSGQRLELLVAVVEYRTKLKAPRLGLCSNWLKSLNRSNKVYGWIKNGTFKFPKDIKTPVIMVGPGTGLAPFRSYIQERVSLGTAHSDILHLYFGCRYRNKDFHCGEELESLEKEGKLSLYCAFSRDQENKIYVQHKIIENSESIWRLVNEENASIFISGNAKNMPDNVKDALVEVFSKTGGVKEEVGKEMLKNMENVGRLQLETW